MLPRDRRWLIGLMLAAAVVPVTAAPALPVFARIVFVHYDGHDEELFSMDPDGSNILQLTDNAWDDMAPVRSPDGTKIAFQRYTWGGQWAIFVIDEDGGNPTRITPKRLFALDPTWSPDGTHIAFAGNWAEDYADLWTIGADGHGLTKVLRSPREYETGTAWSPDGTTLAFVRERPGLPARLATTPVDGRGVTLLTDPDLSVSDADGVDWSPDGSRLAFAAYGPSDQPQVYTMSATGSDLTRITGSAGPNIGPAWAPDGTRLAWACDVGGVQICAKTPGVPGRLVLTSSGGEEPDW